MGKEEWFMKQLISILLCLMLLGPGLAQADNLARDYIPAPPGTLAILMYYQHISSNSFYRQGRLVNSDLGLSGNIGLFRPVYWLEAGPLIIDPQFIIPFGNLDLKGGPSSSGLGDPIWFATFWFVHNHDTKTYVGFTPFFFTPLGTYQREKGAINLGENRWRFREEFAVVQGVEVISGHNAYFEIQLGVDLFTKNTDFLNPGFATKPQYGSLSQQPIFNVESHISYDLTKTVWASMDYYGHFFGKQKYEGISLGNELNNHRLGGTLAFSFAPGYQLLLQYSGDVAVENGPKGQYFMARFLWATDIGSLTGKKSK
jgi:hypothetical protein